MIRKETIAAVTLGVTMFGSFAVTAQVTPPTAPDQAAPPTAPGMPPAGDLPSAVPPAGNLPPAQQDPAAGMPSALPGMPQLPGMPGAMPPGGPQVPGQNGQIQNFTTMNQSTGATLAPAVPTPPPLGNMAMETADDSTTTGTAGTAASPSQLYTFLFIDDPEYGIVRQKFESGVAEDIKQAEIDRLMTARRTNQQPGAGAGILGVTPGFNPMGMGDPAMMGDPSMMGGAGMMGDPAMMGGDPLLGGVGLGAGGIADTGAAIRAAAEWDFYYDQLEMYDRYIRENLIPDAESLPVLEYNAANALQERQDLFESFQEEAIEQSNVDYNENLMLYERLQMREDRRRDYTDWLLLKEREIADWTEVWARRINATRWADGEEVRVDDWYYGTDFNSADPVLVQIDDREYIISRQPARNLEDGQLNVISSNMTPYDIVDYNGYLKNPVMETMRGTLVIPPAGPVYTTDSGAGTTGTIEIVGGMTTE